MNSATAPNVPGSNPAPGAPTPAPPMSAEQVRESLSGKFVCPFCGAVNDSEHGVCARCTMENSAATRKATKQRIGPWYVLQARNPAAPGMRFETLLAFVRKGRVKPKSVVRGPTTHQLWKFAAQVKGLSREFGLCYSCGGAIETWTKLCPHCNHLQEPPPNPDILLETGKDGVAVPPGAATPATAATAVATAPAAPVPRAGRPAAHHEPSLEAGEADFVVPALGGGSDESLAGFSLAGSMAGVTVNPEWARIDPAAGRTRPPRPGVEAPAAPGAQSAQGAPGAQAYGAPARPAPRPRPVPNPGDSVAGYPSVAGHAPAGSSPASGNGDRRRRDRDPEGFLSAKDLAAAFKLDFVGGATAPSEAAPGYPAGAAAAPAGRVPGAGYAQPHAPAQPRVQVPSSIPAALREPVRRRRRFGAVKVLLLLLVTGAALYAAAAWIDEGFRRDSFAWFARLKASLLDLAGGNNNRGGRTGSMGGTGSPGAGPALRTPTATQGSSGDTGTPSQYSPSDRSVATDPFEEGAPELASSNLPAASPPPATRPSAPVTRPAAPAAKAGVEAKPAPPAPPASSPATQPGLPLLPGVPEAQTAFVSPPSASAPADGRRPPQAAAVEMRMWKLYRDAMDLERTDAAKAAALYREIKSLPPEVWPKDLDTRIREAEKLHRIRNSGG